MANVERMCVAYFSDAIKSEKQTDSSSVNINDLKIYLTNAPKEVRAYVQTSSRGDLAAFFSRYPEVFQVERNSRVFLTADIIRMHGPENLEKLSVEFFADRLKTMKAFQNSAIPIMALKRHLNEAPSGVQSLFYRNYFGKDFKRFFCNHQDVFVVSNSGNVYLRHGVSDPAENGITGMFGDASGIMESEISQDERDAIDFYRRVLNSPGIELQACSIDSLFAQLCEAPDNVQRFLHRNYNEFNFLDFFNAHKEVFNITMNGQTSLNDYAPAPPAPSEFPPLIEADSPISVTPELIQESCRRPRILDSEEEAITFFRSVIRSYTDREEIAHVEKLRDHLASAPLIVFSYFHSKYPYRDFEKFFLNHASHFTIDSSGAVELAQPAGKGAGTPPKGEKESGGQWKSPSRTSSPHEAFEMDREEACTIPYAKNHQFEAQLEKFFLDVLQVAHTYSVRVVGPVTLLAISSCLNRRLSAYLAERYGKDITPFFQQHPNRFRVSKNGNVCLAVERDFCAEVVGKKTASELTAEFLTTVLQLLQNHQVKAVAPEVLWEFLPLGPPKVSGFLLKHYEKETFKSFFTKFPKMFAISKNKNVYLAAGMATGVGTDTSDDDCLEYARASGDPCEVAAIEFFIDRVRSLKLSCYPVPSTALKESLAKASPRVRAHFEETYPQEKFLDFFLKYKDFFFVMKPINVIWLTRTDSDDLADEDPPVHCPLSNRSKIFRQVVGVVAANLLLKSPKPFSTILGHLYTMVSQHGQELGKYPGKSNTERLCSLLGSCLNMFKIVKDNVILSWPLKHSSSLVLCLEEALAGVCVQLARHDTVSFGKFYTELRMKTERMFQCFIPDAETTLDFLRKREEFYVVNHDQFIALTTEMSEEQMDEVTAIVEKELKTRSGGMNLQLLLSSIREERFQHSYTCGVIMNAIMKRKDKFYLDDGRVFLEVNEGTRDRSPASVPLEETTSGTGWITSVEDDGGTIAAALGSNSEYAQVRFHKSVLNKGASQNLELNLGDEVDFIASRKGNDLEWVVVTVSKALCAALQQNGEEGAGHAGGSLQSFSCESSNEEENDDDSSTNGEDRIFYSSASDADPQADAASVLSSKEPGAAADAEREAQSEEATLENGVRNAGVGEVAASKQTSSVCSEDRWSSTSDMSHVASMLSLINTDEDETPYDRRIMSSMTSHRLKRIKELLSSEMTTENGTPMSDAEVSDGPRSSDRVGDASGETAEKEAWDGTGIWDVEPFVEVMEAQHMDMRKETKEAERENAAVQEEDWEAELDDGHETPSNTEPRTVSEEPALNDTETLPADSKEEDQPNVFSEEYDETVSLTPTNDSSALHYSRDVSPTERPSLADELNLDLVTLTKGEQAAYLEAGAGDSVRSLRQETSPGADVSLTVEGPPQAVPSSPGRCSTPVTAVGDANSKNMSEDVEEAHAGKGSPSISKDPLLEEGPSLRATVAQIDGSTVLLRVDTESLAKWMGLPSNLGVGSEVLIGPQGIASPVDGAGNSVAEDASTQTISTGAIFAANLVID